MMPWTMKRLIKAGDLVRIKSHDGWSVCLPVKPIPDILTSFFLKERKLEHINSISERFKVENEIYKNLLGEVALVSKIKKNRLDQPESYEVIIEGRRMKCRAIIAEKYFEVINNEK